MKAITTKYLGPTTYKGSRIKAFDMDGNSVTMSRDFGKALKENMKMAAYALCDKMGWDIKKDYRLVGGYVKDGMVWVFVTKCLCSCHKK